MRSFALVLTALSLIAAGCGDDDEDPTTAASPPAATEAPTEAPTEAATEEATGAGATLEVAANPGGSIAYVETDLTAAAGSVELKFSNPSSTPHDVVIENDGGEVGRVDVTTQGDATATVDLEAGQYTFYCSVGNHRDQGMEGTLTVE